MLQFSRAHHFYTKPMGMALIFLSLGPLSSAQSTRPNIQRMEPPHWWNSGIESEFVLTLYGPNLSECEVSSGHADVVVQHLERRENKDYLFVRLQTRANCLPADVPLKVSSALGMDTTLFYPILDGRQGLPKGQGVPSGATMYLIMPDRFANGDLQNDVNANLRESSVDRTEMYARHGGDLEGIATKLDYLDALGIDAIWLNPVLLNDQPSASYHGYAVTNHYEVDPRLGGNKAYRDLVSACHAKDIRVIQDVIFNHWGHNHWMIQNLPDRKWLHQWPEFTLTNYNCNVMTDPHAVKEEVDVFNRGWFVPEMPDLAPDQDPLLADLLVQNALWWISEAGIDGFRIDTYPYSDKDFMATLAQRILAIHPDFFMFGECWVSSPAVQSSYLSKSPLSTQNSHLESVKDFQLHFALRDAIGEDPTWRTGITRVHATLSQDGVYPDPNRLVTFVDNHDTDRWRSVAGDMARTRYGIGLVMMTRGIPCLYYGTELGMDGFAAPDGLVRDDFPGGWHDDARNAFKESGRTPEERELWKFTAALGQARRTYRGAFASPMTHLIPRKGQYHFLRADGEQRLLILSNASDEPAEVDWSALAPLQEGATKGQTILGATGSGAQRFLWGAPLTLAPWHFAVYRLEN